MAKGKDQDPDKIAEKIRRTRAKQEDILIEGIIDRLKDLVLLYRSVLIEPWTMAVICQALATQALLQSTDRESPFKKRRGGRKPS